MIGLGSVSANIAVIRRSNGTPQNRTFTIAELMAKSGREPTGRFGEINTRKVDSILQHAHLHLACTRSRRQLRTTLGASRVPRIPPPLIAIIFALMTALLARFAPLIQFWFPGKTPVALIVASMGVALDVWAALCFRAARTTVNPVAIENASALVTNGPFMFSRNPMYVGLVLILTCLLYTSPSPRDGLLSRMPSSA